MNEITELPVEFLFTMHLDLDAPVLMPAGPHGTRVFVTVLNGTVTGPRISGTVVPSSGADWVTVRADGYSQLDVRLLITTDDGAVISMQYGGILDTGPDRRPRTAPLFQTSHERYAWLNNVQGVAIGTPGRNEVTYQVYALA